jgi:SAM-dependent methyltransferase
MSRLGRLRDGVRSIVPRAWLRRIRPSSLPVPGRVDFGDFRRTRPISRHFGFERGQPIDRFYVERFLAANTADIRGRVLEIGDASYTRQFGGDRVTQSDVLHVVEGAPEATIIGDLTAADHIPSDIFDCIVLTQTLHLVYDVPAAIATIRRILAPGGVLLATVPGISQIDRGQWKDTWFWSFTVPAARRRFEEHFAAADVRVEASGNALAAVAFLEGLASHELREDELLVFDEAYPVCVAIRAVKGSR